MSKVDAKLGHEVHKHLVSIGLETPMVEDRVAVPAEDKIKALEPLFEEILTVLGVDLTDDSMQDTPRRVAKMYVQELFSGLVPDNFPKCTAIENKMAKESEVVLVNDITMFSSCEHHLVTIQGKKVAVAYVPHDYVLGLSKINRIVEYFGKRPQVQERLTYQIAHAISYVTKSPDVLVYIDAEHFCVKQRGVRDTNSSTTTVAALGVFAGQANPFRKEVLDSIR